MKQIKKLILAFAMIPMLALSTLSTGCGDDNFANVVDAMASRDNLDTFLDLIETVNLDDTLRGSGPFTVFAPTDAAFAAINPDLFNKLVGDLDALSLFLTSHIVADRLNFDDLVDIADTKGVIDSLSGENITVDFDGTDVFVNGAKIIESDIEADNGVVQIVDEILVLL